MYPFFDKGNPKTCTVINQVSVNSGVGVTELEDVTDNHIHVYIPHIVEIIIIFSQKTTK
jgi:hypothetical protein